MYVKKLCVTEIRSSTTYTSIGTNDFNKANGEEKEKKKQSTYYSIQIVS